MSILTDIAAALHSFPTVDRYELYCDISVFYAIQRSGDFMSRYPPTPLDFIFGADVIVAPELGNGVWELYGNGKLIDYGRIRE